MYFQRLRDLREDDDKSQQRIANMLNLSLSAYKRYENGTREAPAWVIVELAQYYKVSTDYLLGLTNKK